MMMMMMIISLLCCLRCWSAGQMHQRSRILSVYRSLLRSSRSFPTAQGRAVIPLRIRNGFREHMSESDGRAVEALLATADAHLSYMELKETDLRSLKSRRIQHPSRRGEVWIEEDGQPAVEVPDRAKMQKESERWTLSYLDLIQSIQPSPGFQYHIATKPSDAPLVWPPAAQRPTHNAHLYARDPSIHVDQSVASERRSIVGDLHTSYSELPLMDFKMADLEGNRLRLQHAKTLEDDGSRMSAMIEAFLKEKFGIQAPSAIDDETFERELAAAAADKIAELKKKHDMEDDLL
ncbi:mitochondrial Complex1_LYR family protein [Andalucia godoyi]|uniref:Mitochondrial Complex1_LYR family protein n=1 Tax=Andalucia godoyi TaxID=505711 RepID=A0A8K0AIG6_ANDGO|nr:mitochondrial Complex1_LYR family protein [Andalucia godoyi]|eukprot:ANDGO_06084.mRNA.1 mitochondrial Complex1_LYR family protein